jgi:cell division control protein 45
MTPRELYQDRRNRLRQYYAHGSFYGCPAAYAAYVLAQQSRFHDVGDLLWLACVGVTDAYLHARLDLSGYSALVLQLRDKCHTLFPMDEFTRMARQTVYAEHLLGNNNNNTTGPLTKIAFTGNGRILAETDFRFFLLRHTSLYEAMRLSDYVSTQLQLPTAKGLHKLQEMLAQMGFPLAECQQPFCFMKPALRRQLRDKLQEQMHDYNLEHLEFTSFFRVTGYQSLLSASDTSYAVTALLECSPDQTATASRASSDDDDDAQEERRLLQAFYTALDALAPTTSSSDATNINSNNNNSLANLVNGVSLSSSSGLGAGLKLALQLQKSIIATATSLMDRNAITRLSHFRYAYITTTPQGEGSGSAPGGEPQQSHQNTTCFAQPLALTRLAHYLMDWNRANGKWAGRSRPLVLLAERSTFGFLVVGCEFPEAAGDATRNRFGHYFELVAQSLPQSQWRRDFDSFDGHVVHVARPDAQRFLEQLHYLLDRMNE